jgi:hypothetical protein
MPGEGDGWMLQAAVAKQRPGRAANYEDDCSDVATFWKVLFALVPID